MNKLVGKVKDIKVMDVVTYIDVAIKETEIRLIKFKAPKWLSVGDTVYCQIPEASVCVSKECPGKISIENRIPSTLIDVRKSESLCELTFESEIGVVVSLITTDSYENLALEKDCEATILLRGVDINLESLVPPVEILSRIKDAN